MKKELIKVAITGPRPENMAGVPESYIRSDIRDTLEILLEEFDGKVEAYSGMARGVDTIFAKQAVRMNIPLFAIIPFTGFESMWSQEDKNTFYDLLHKTRDVKVVCDAGSKAAYQERNIWMVNCVDRLLAYHVPGVAGGTANCIQYAASVNLPIRTIDITKLFSMIK